MTNTIRTLSLLELSVVAAGVDNCGDVPTFPWNLDPFAINDPVFIFPTPPPDKTWGVPTPEPVIPKLITKG